VFESSLALSKIALGTEEFLVLSFLCLEWVCFLVIFLSVYKKIRLLYFFKNESSLTL
jgi:hypothetical protein